MFDIKLPEREAILKLESEVEPEEDILLRGVHAWNRCRILNAAINAAEARHDHDSVQIYKAMLKIEADPNRAFNAPQSQI
jgi:hypothetical protein